MTDVKYILLAWELHCNKVSILNISRHCKKHRATVANWIKNIEEKGLDSYLAYFQTVKKKERKPRQVRQEIKRQIWELMAEHQGISGYRIHSYLTDKLGFSISVSKVYVIMKEKNEKF